MDSQIIFVKHKDAFQNKKDEQQVDIPYTVELKDGAAYMNSIQAQSGYDTIKVVNTPNNDPGGGGFILPRTGGMGTLMFTIIGIVLISIAVLILTIRRKRTKQQ